MLRSPYQLGIDLGTTCTAAAVCRADGRPEVVALHGRALAVPTVAFLAPDATLLLGEAAARCALTDPRRVVREFKRRIGDPVPLVVGDVAVPAEDLAADFVAWVLARVTEHEGGPAERVTLTHPVEWGPHKRDRMARALATRGLGEVAFLPEPQAAAVGYACAEHVAPGDVVAVYDLGGGTFDAAVVRRLADGGFETLGRPAGIERLGGVDFDDVVFEHVRAALGPTWDALDPGDPAVQAAVAGLRRACTAAKEALSADTEVLVPVLLPGLVTNVRLGRAEFEDMIRPAVAATVDTLRRVIASAGVEPAELRAVLLVGGSSRIPLVAQLVSGALGRAVAMGGDPKSVVANGAAAARLTLDAAPDLTAALPGEATVAIPRVMGADRPPPSPPLDLGPVIDAPDDQPDRPLRRRALMIATAVAAVAATFALTATVPSGVTTVGRPTVGAAAAEPGPAAPTAPTAPTATSTTPSVVDTTAPAAAGTRRAVPQPARTVAPLVVTTPAAAPAPSRPDPPGGRNPTDEAAPDPAPTADPPAPAAVPQTGSAPESGTTAAGDPPPSTSAPQ